MNLSNTSITPRILKTGAADWMVLPIVESMKLGLPTILESERTPLVQALLAIIDAQYQRIQQMEETVQQLRDEIAILKGQKPKPQIAPSQLEKPPKAAPSEGQKRPGSEKRCKNITLVITEERRVSVPDKPMFPTVSAARIAKFAKVGLNG